MKYLRVIARVALGAALVFAGFSHLTTLRQEFRAQVPIWLPLDPDFVVVASGIVEIILGLALLVAGRFSPIVGVATAIFFIAIFPGNINQYVQGINAFGLNSDQSRLTRLFFQPLLVIWAIWSTGAWSSIISVLIRPNRQAK